MVPAMTEIRMRVFRPANCESWTMRNREHSETLGSFVAGAEAAARVAAAVANYRLFPTKPVKSVREKLEYGDKECQTPRVESSPDKSVVRQRE